LADGSLAGRTIVVDPGHGGIDGGASAYGRVEKNITLPIGLDLGAILRGQGAAVVYTRSTEHLCQSRAAHGDRQPGGSRRVRRYPRQCAQ